MELLSSILGKFIGVGVIALLIVFQQEVRKFLLHLGSRYNFSQKFSFEKWLSVDEKFIKDKELDAIIESCENMAKSKTGALIVITKRTDLYSFAETGQILKARISSSLLESIFFKNSPLHDGALILDSNRILAARCILPVTDNPNIPGSLGLRHRSAIGISQMTDAHVIIVSEETGYISYVMGGKIKVKINPDELRRFLNADYSSFES